MQETAVRWCLQPYSGILPLAQDWFLVAIFVIGPLCAFRKTRHEAGVWLVIISYTVGITTWLLGATATFAWINWWGFLIGVLLFGVGVGPSRHSRRILLTDIPCFTRVVSARNESDHVGSPNRGLAAKRRTQEVNREHEEPEGSSGVAGGAETPGGAPAAPRATLGDLFKQASALGVAPEDLQPIASDRLRRNISDEQARSQVQQLLDQAKGATK